MAANKIECTNRLRVTADRRPFAQSRKLHTTSRISFAIMLAVIAQMAIAADPSQPYSIPDAKLPITGIDRSEFESFDQMMETFLREHHVPGASLAVTQDGRLVYARGFGYGDLGRQTPVQPDSLFRIASISKPITAFAVLQLVERGKIQLDGSAFSQLGLDVEGETRDSRLKEVTVRHLLQHTGGWDRNSSFDPMSAPTRSATMKKFNVTYPFNPGYIVLYMLDKPLDFDPGSKYAYSNFGYCILGRLIEKISRKPYDEYVKQNVLTPIGIRQMRIGQMNSYQPKEVRYYHHHKTVADHFSIRQDLAVDVYESHGGWIASAIDLVRFGHENNELVANSRRGRRQILSPNSFLTMFSRPGNGLWLDSTGKPKPSFYGCGWDVRPKSNGRNIWHTGSLTGTSSILVRRNDNLCWSVLFNSRENRQGDKLGRLIDPLVHKAASKVPAWPDKLDLSRRY